MVEFGARAALWRLVERLDLVGIIVREVPKRHQGVSIGHFLVLAALNRVVAPKSKTQIGVWYEKTWLRRLIRHRAPGPFLRWHCTAAPRDVPTLTTHWDDAAIAAFQEQHFGKTLLFTDHTDWSAPAIVAAYRGQGSLENAFRQMKDPHFVTSRPVFHWTDQKIQVHAACCVWALLLASLPS